MNGVIEDPLLSLNTLKVQELKQICREHGVAPVGKKAELIEKLVAFRSSLEMRSQVAARQPEGTYSSPAAAIVADARTHAMYAEQVQRMGSYSPVQTQGRARTGARGGRVSRGSQGSPVRGVSPGGRAGRGGRGRSRGGRGSRGGCADVGAGDRAAGSPACAMQPLKCAECGQNCDVRDQLQNMRNVREYWCPMCRFKLMDPFNAVAEPRGLLYGAASNQQGRFEFVLDLPDLRTWRRENMSIQVRMVKVSCPKMAHNWPKVLHFGTNGAEIFSVLPPEEGHKRRDVPQDISGSLRVGRNNVSIRLFDETPLDYVVGIVLTIPCGIKELREQIDTCEKDDAMRRVMRILTKQAQAMGSRSDECVCLAPDKLKLLCPITMDRIDEPVRGQDCQHIQCFGLEAHITSNRQMKAFNNRWVCPVCSLVLRPYSLVFDQYCAEILAATDADCEEVFIDANTGAWGVVESDKKGGNAPSPDSDVDEVDLASPSPAKTCRAPLLQEIPALALPPARAGNALDHGGNQPRSEVLSRAVPAHCDVDGSNAASKELVAVPDSQDSLVQIMRIHETAADLSLDLSAADCGTANANRRIDVGTAAGAPRFSQFGGPGKRLRLASNGSANVGVAMTANQAVKTNGSMPTPAFIAKKFGVGVPTELVIELDEV